MSKTKTKIVQGTKTGKKNKLKRKLKSKAICSLSSTSFVESKTLSKAINKVKHHSYNAEEIQFYINLRNSGNCSYRGCIKAVEVIVKSHLGITLKVPCHNSVRNWMMKAGYSILNEPSKRNKSVLFLDESVSIGSQKILAVLALNLSGYNFNCPIKLSDVEVVSLQMRSSWKAEDIQEVIQQAQNRGYVFKYCCCDNGNNLRKALRMSQITHIEDCGHCLGKVLEKEYKKEEQYLKFKEQKTLFKKQNLLSKYAYLVPPHHRSKGRFMNLWSTCKWAKQTLELAQLAQKEESQTELFRRIKWILPYEKWIKKLYQKQQTINTINKILKHFGLSKSSLKNCEEILNQSKTPIAFQQQIMDYLKRNKSKTRFKKVICSSDVIESFFGKVKSSIRDNLHHGLTEGILGAALLGKQLTPKQIKNGLEKYKIKHIAQWRKNNLPISMQTRKNQLVKKLKIL